MASRGQLRVVISRTILYGALAAFIAAVYVALVVAVPYAVSGRGGEPSLLLSILATAVVAVAFHPLRERLQRLANRLVFGRRSTPYEVLSGFSDRVAGTYSTEDVLPRMARIIAEATAATRAEVWLRVGDDLLREAGWPSPAGGADGGSPDHLAVSDDLDRLGGDAAVPVRHRGDILGAVVVRKRPGEALTPAERGLLEDLASQAGLVLRNARLTAELRARLDEVSSRAAALRASRQRIVEAQDSERRRLERDIHDGAQQHLVALAVKLRLARTMAGRDPERARGLLDQLRSEIGAAVETLRDLALGIYPPVLAERGIGPAIRAQAGRFPFAVDVTDEGLPRYAPEVEAAVYFAALEALQNAAKHAAASRVRVTLAGRDGDLTFDVVDDGSGFDAARATRGAGLRNLADRLVAVEGTVDVDAEPGRGTRISGRVPVRGDMEVPA